MYWQSYCVCKVSTTTHGIFGQSNVGDIMFVIVILAVSILSILPVSSFNVAYDDRSVVTRLEMDLFYNLTQLTSVEEEALSLIHI